MGHQLKPQPCPACRQVLDAAGGIDTPKPPDQNDVTVCIYCAAVLQYRGPELKLVQPTHDEIVEWPAEVRAQLAKIVAAVRQVNKGKR